MARLTAEDFDISLDRGEVVLRIAGRAGALRLSADDALLVSNGLGNAAVDSLDTGAERLPVVDQVHLRPFSDSGVALLRLTVRGLGPLTVAIDQHWLRALAAASEAALEFSDGGGRA